MDLKKFVFAACLLIGSVYAQDNQYYNNLYADLGDIGVSPSLINSTGQISLSGAYIQELIDDAREGSSISIPTGNHVLDQPLYINKNVTIVGSEPVALHAQ